MINAITISECLRTKYLRDNAIKGCFLAKNWHENGKQYYEVLEGNESMGYVAGEFKLKREALAFIRDWCKVTGLPRFANCYHD